MGCKKKCTEISTEDCDEDLCDFEVPANCVEVELANLDFIEDVEDLEDNLQSVLNAIASLFEAGFSGTVENPTTITVLNGLVINVE